MTNFVTKTKEALNFNFDWQNQIKYSFSITAQIHCINKAGSVTTTEYMRI